jgi:hypothetical protein
MGELDSVSIEDILGDTVEDKVESPSVDDADTGLKTTGVFIDEDAAKKEIEDLKGTLRSHTRNCRNLFVDLRSVDFKANDQDMYLTFKDKDFFSKTLYFKHDPDDAKNPKNLHAQKQFCKFLGVPHSFFKDNRPSLKENIVRTWQAGLNAEDKPKKYQCVARIREKEDHAIVRAIVPMDFTMLDNHELLDIISENVTYTHKLHFKTGAVMDDLTFHARFLFANPFKVRGEDVCLGFAITASELGASSLDVDILIHHIESDTSIIATYGGDPFFSCKYTGIRSEEIKELFPALIERMNNEEQEIQQRIEEKLYQIYPEVECGVVKNIKGFNTKFKKALYHEVAEASDDMTTPWDFARHMGLIAKDFDILMRTKIERSIGTYLNLVFPA